MTVKGVAQAEERVATAAAAAAASDQRATEAEAKATSSAASSAASCAFLSDSGVHRAASCRALVERFDIESFSDFAAR